MRTRGVQYGLFMLDLGAWRVWPGIISVFDPRLGGEPQFGHHLRAVEFSPHGTSSAAYRPLGRALPPSSAPSVPGVLDPAGVMPQNGIVLIGVAQGCPTTSSSWEIILGDDGRCIGAGAAAKTEGT